MNGKYLLEKMELIDPVYIEAAEKRRRKPPISWQRWAGLAACVTAALISGIILFLLPGGGIEVAEGSTETASLFSTGGIPLIVFVLSLLAGLGLALVIIKDSKKKK